MGNIAAECLVMSFNLTVLWADGHHVHIVSFSSKTVAVLRKPNLHNNGV